MNIIDDRKTILKFLYELKDGDIFLYKDRCYIKTDMGSYGAVDLLSGATISFADNTKVEVVKATLTIKD